MQVAIIGLGRMGKNVCLHLLEQGVKVVAYNRSRDDVDEVVKKGAIGAYSLGEIPAKWLNNVGSGDDNKVIVTILFVPAGGITEGVLFGHEEQKGLVEILPKDSIIIDAGNSFFKDSQRRYGILKAKGMHFLDMGTSGGIEGARNGACLMVGGDEEIYRKVEGIFAKIATKDGYGYFGPSGSGHFVKMIHNAIEYGMIGALAEGFNLLPAFSHQLSDKGQNSEIDLAKLARVWAHGSIVSGHLMKMAERVFSKDPQLKEIQGEVPRGETESEIEWLEKTGIPNPVIQTSRKQRVETRSKPSFIGKVIAALRREFGGHAVKEKT